MSVELKHIYFEVKDISDLVRFAVSSGLTKPLQIMHYHKGDKHYYFSYLVSSIRDTPVILVYYYVSSKEHPGKYALINLDGEPEKVEFSDSTKRGKLIAPVVHLKNIPENIQFP
ncbi:MAG: hypothetical protein ACTSSJ_01720 [Candidatus Odinarchaeia archaeon]